MNAPATEALTIPTMARILNQPVHRVEYIVMTRRINFRARAGIVRLFDEAALEALRTEFDRLERIEAERASLA